MGIPDRIILTLYTILMAVVAVFLVLFALQIIAPTTVYAFCATIPGKWEYAVGGVVLLLVSLRLLVTGLGGTGVSTLSLGDDKEGKIHVSKNAVEDYVSEIANDIYGVHNAKASAKMIENALNFLVLQSLLLYVLQFLAHGYQPRQLQIQSYFPLLLLPFPEFL